MDNCFAACACDDLEGVTKSDLDRFTDKIENVLGDEKGRRLFRNFMFSSKMKNGRKVLDFWENTERLLNYRQDSDSVSYRNYLRDFDRLIDSAERIEELDLATMERLIMARESENNEEMKDILKLLKIEATKALKKEYNAFRLRFIPSKQK